MATNATRLSFTSFRYPAIVPIFSPQNLRDSVSLWLFSTFFGDSGRLFADCSTQYTDDMSDEIADLPPEKAAVFFELNDVFAGNKDMIAAYLKKFGWSKVIAPNIRIERSRPFLYVFMKCLS